jgi:hypothetical protein
VSARAALALSAILALAATAPPARAQQGAFRFDITAVGDSTVNFRTADVSWLTPGMKGIAVDPARHDVLIARLEVIRVSGSLATAVVTGQTSRVTTDYVALIEPPQKKWYQQPAVWIGTAAGLALGIVIAR